MAKLLTIKKEVYTTCASCQTPINAPGCSSATINLELGLCFHELCWPKFELAQCKQTDQVLDVDSLRRLPSPQQADLISASRQLRPIIGELQHYKFSFFPFSTPHFPYTVRFESDAKWSSTLDTPGKHVWAVPTGWWSEGHIAVVVEWDTKTMVEDRVVEVLQSAITKDVLPAEWTRIRLIKTENSKRLYLFINLVDVPKGNEWKPLQPDQLIIRYASRYSDLLVARRTTILQSIQEGVARESITSEKIFFTPDNCKSRAQFYTFTAHDKKVCYLGAGVQYVEDKQPSIWIQDEKTNDLIVCVRASQFAYPVVTPHIPLVRQLFPNAFESCTSLHSVSSS